MKIKPSPIDTAFIAKLRGAGSFEELDKLMEVYAELEPPLPRKRAMEEVRKVRENELLSGRG